MFIDKNLELFDDVAIPDATTADSEALPLHTTGEIARESGGEPMEVVIQVTQTATTGTSLTCSVITGTDASFTSANTHYTGPTVVLAELVAGYKIRLPLAFGEADADATHWGVRLTGAGTFGAGTVSGWIQRAGEDQRSFGANGY